MREKNHENYLHRVRRERIKSEKDLEGIKRTAGLLGRMFFTATMFLNQFNDLTKYYQTDDLLNRGYTTAEIEKRSQAEGNLSHIMGTKGRELAYFFHQ